MAADKSKAGSVSADENGPYTGKNPYAEGTAQFNAWAYLKSTVDADRRKGMDVTKPPKD